MTFSPTTKAATLAGLRARFGLRRGWRLNTHPPRSST